MSSPDPIYAAENCEVAYQLIWGLTVFWRQPPGSHQWLESLAEQTDESDNIRILKHRFSQPTVSQFPVSTQPHVVPLDIPARVKGRLQHLIREQTPKAFERNYTLRSIGSTKRDKLEAYIEMQPEHHPMADPDVQARLDEFQIVHSKVDLSRPRHTTHGQYWYNLHIVMENADGLPDIRESVLQATHEMILRVSRTKSHLLSRAGIVSDHLHLTLGCALDESPLDVALSYMNNLAFAQEMRPVFRYSCYLGTFGEYDLGAIR